MRDNQLIIKALQRGDAVNVVRAIEGEIASLDVSGPIWTLNGKRDEEILGRLISNGILVCAEDVFETKMESAIADYPELTDIFYILRRLRKTGGDGDLRTIQAWARKRWP